MLGGNQVSSGGAVVIAVTQMRDHIFLRQVAAAGSSLSTAFLFLPEIAAFERQQEFREQSSDLRNENPIFCST